MAVVYYYEQQNFGEDILHRVYQKIFTADNEWEEIFIGTYDTEKDARKVVERLNNRDKNEKIY